MEQAIQIFNNPDFGDVRAVEIDGEGYLVGADVAISLGYKDAYGALKKHVDDEDKLVCQIDSAGQKRDATVINESGVYSMILRSNLPKAKEFKRWVTGEVLPSIRKYGVYADPRREITAEMLRRMADALDARDKKIALLEVQNAELQPKADYCDVILWLLYQKYAAKGWSQTKTHKYTGGDGQQHCKVHTYWTQKGRIELYHILKRNGIVPMIER